MRRLVVVLAWRGARLWVLDCLHLVERQACAHACRCRGALNGGSSADDLAWRRVALWHGGVRGYYA